MATENILAGLLMREDGGREDDDDYELIEPNRNPTKQHACPDEGQTVHFDEKYKEAQACRCQISGR